MIKPTKVVLTIEETDLRERAFETLKRYGFVDDRATELSFAIVKEVRRVAAVSMTYELVPDETPPKGGPYR